MERIDMERRDLQCSDPERHDRRMSRRQALALFCTLAATPALAVSPRAAALEVYKNPSCGCCGGWVDHLRRSGFAVTVREVADTAPVRARLGMPEALGSCHTATIDRYVIEGHVPAEDIRRLLAERPDALGLAVPGMPAGTPGMETGGPARPYDVLLVAKSGRSSVFATHRP